MIDISTNDRFTMHIDSIRLIIITISRYPAVTIRYDTIEEINVDSKAEYTA